MHGMHSVKRRDAPAHDDLTSSQQQRRDRIVGAAVELLAEHDYDDIHMTQVAERAGVALGTLYRYFPAKERLFVAALLEWAGRYERHAVGRVRTSDDARARVKAVLGAAARAFERNPHFLKPISVLGASDDPEVRALHAEYTNRTSGVIRAELDRAVGADAEAIELMLLSSLNTLLRWWASGQCSMREVRRQLDACVDIVVPG